MLDIRPNSIHTFWYNPDNGNVLPTQDANCISSWVHQEKTVYIWTYGELLSDELTDLIHSFPSQVHICDAERLIPQTEYFVADYAHIDAHGFAMFSDIMRYIILHNFGGWWLDTDIILLNESKLESLENRTANRPLIFFERYSNNAKRLMVNNAVIYCAQTEMLTELMYRAHQAIAQTKFAIENGNADSIVWGNTGPVLFTDMYEESYFDVGPVSDFYLMDFYPHTQSMQKFAHETTSSYDMIRFLSQQPLGIHLWNSYLHKSGGIASGSLIDLCLELASEFEPITISNLINRMSENTVGTFIDVTLPFNE